MDFPHATYCGKGFLSIDLILLLLLLLLFSLIMYFQHCNIIFPFIDPLHPVRPCVGFPVCHCRVTIVVLQGISIGLYFVFLRFFNAKKISLKQKFRWIDKSWKRTMIWIKKTYQGNTKCEIVENLKNNWIRYSFTLSVNTQCIWFGTGISTASWRRKHHTKILSNM